MLVSELKEIVKELEDTATIEGIYVKRDPVQFHEKDGLTRFICNIVTKKGYSTTKTSFKYESEAVSAAKDKQPAEKVAKFASLFGGNR